MGQEKDSKKINYHRVKTVAGSLFLKNGYGNTSMNDIADTLQIKKASLYHHIQTREQLLIDIIRDIEQLLETEFVKMDALTGYNQQKKSFMQTLKHFYYNNDLAYLILKLSYETSNEEIIQSINKFIDLWIKRFVFLLVQKTEKPQAKETSLKITHQLIGTLICSKLTNKKQMLVKTIKDIDMIL